MTKVRILTNRTAGVFLFDIGRRQVQLSPFANRNPHSNSSTCYAIIDQCSPEQRRTFENVYLARKHAECVSPAAIIGMQKCNVHVADESGNIEPLSGLMPGLCGQITLDFLQEKFPGLFPSKTEGSSTPPPVSGDKENPATSNQVDSSGGDSNSRPAQTSQGSQQNQGSKNQQGQQPRHVNR